MTYADWFRRNADRVAATALTAFGVFWMIAAARQTYFVDTPHISLSFLPFAAGAVLTLLSICIIFRPSQARPESEAPGDQSEIQATDADRGGTLRVIFALLTLVVYAILLPRVHSLLTTFGIMVVSLALSGEPLRPRLFIIAAVAAILLYLIFVIWLGVPLPGGLYT
jgi:hypothetical protein